MRRWLRTAADRVGIRLPFTGVICVEGVQRMAIDAGWDASVTTARTLVFLESPNPGDLHDTYALGTDGPISGIVYESPDAVELARENVASGRLRIAWRPRDPVTLYTLYAHQNGWRPTASFNRAAVCVEYHCDMRTGLFTIELDAPAPFEAAAVFARPRWPRRMSDARIVHHALSVLKQHRQEPRILDDGTRIAWTIRAPRVGTRYVFVAFRRGGVATWERQLKETSIVGRVQRLVTTWTDALAD